MQPTHPPTVSERLALRALWLAGLTPLRRPLARRFLTTPMFNPAAFQGYTPDARDVFVATFAKSGTNWMMQIAVQALHDGAAEFEHVHELVPWPDCPAHLLAELHLRPPGRRVIKTHLDAEHVPLSDEARYLVVIRDPKDVFVSSYHFVQGVVGGLVEMDYSPEAWLEFFLDPNFAVGDWVTHTAGWWALRDHPAVHLTRFEAMKADLAAEVDAVCAHLDLRLSAEARAAVLDRSGFAWMKAHESQFAPIKPQLRSSEVRMLRKGGTGSKELLNDAQRARIDAVFKARLAELGSDFPYDEVYGAGRHAVKTG